VMRPRTLSRRRYAPSCRHRPYSADVQWGDATVMIVRFSQIPDVARAKAVDLAARSTVEAWAGLASLWGRLFVVADAGWSRWPGARATTLAALAAALRAAVGDVPARQDRRDLCQALENLAIEDDGSAGWQHVTDLTAMLHDALDGCGVEPCIENAIRWYLEGEFNVLSNQLANDRDRPIFQHEAEALVEADARWIRACAFVQAL
jgi:hypothetical protein